jgi:hypothetical protein
VTGNILYFRPLLSKCQFSNVGEISVWVRLPRYERVHSCFVYHTADQSPRVTKFLLGLNKDKSIIKYSVWEYVTFCVHSVFSSSALSRFAKATFDRTLHTLRMKLVNMFVCTYIHISKPRIH